MSFRSVFLQAEDGIRYLVRSRGLGDVYKRQHLMMSGVNFLLHPKRTSRGEIERIDMEDETIEQFLSLIHI